MVILATPTQPKHALDLDAMSFVKVDDLMKRCQDMGVLIRKGAEMRECSSTLILPVQLVVSALDSPMWQGFTPWFENPE